MNFLFQALIYLVLSGVGLLVEAIRGQDQAASEQRAPSGVRGTLDFGGDISPRFIAGRYATAGQLRYGGTFGTDNGTPNAYQARVIEVSCLPIRGFAGWYVFGERVTLDTVPTGDFGYAVLEYRRNGRDYLWIKPYTGAQTTEDPLMLAHFGSHASRPYAGMVGRGTGYFVVTALVNRELFPRFPEILAEVDGIPLDDPRGDNVHTNPMVAIYTLLKGLSYGGQWIWGPQKITGANFRSANLEAEMDKCDVVIDGRPTFTFGIDIALEEQPLTVVGELLKACAGRWADVGGVYKFLVGTPGAPVMSITDDDLIITEQQISEPFPGLENLHNAMGGTYPEPAEAWSMKEAPPRYRWDLEAEDDGRRLMFSTEYRAVWQAVQVQHLMRLALEEARRFRRHSQTMPPDWYEIEPLDVITWTSDRNGYVTKDFLVTVQEDLPTANQFVGLQEIDPNDYAWNSDFELPWDVTPISIERPPAQEVSGAFVEAIVIDDGQGRGRRPGIGVHWDGDMADLRSVRITVRLASTEAVVWEGSSPRPEEGYAPIGQNILNNTAYEVQIQYEPFSGRATVPTSWLAVTTTDVRMSVYDIDDALKQLTGVLAGSGSLIERFDEYRDRLAALANTLVSASAATGNTRAELIQLVNVLADETEASVEFVTLLLAAFGTSNVATAADKVSVTANEFSVQAEFAQEAAVQFGGSSASALRTQVAKAGPLGWDVQIADILRGTTGGTAFEAGTYTFLKSTGESAFAVKAGTFLFYNEVEGVAVDFVRFDGPDAYFKNVKVAGDIIVYGEIITPHMANYAISRQAGFRDANPIDVSNGRGEVQVAAFAITGSSVPGARVKVFAGCNIRAAFNNFNAWGTFECRLRRDGVLWRVARARPDDEGQDGVYVIVDWDDNCAGTHTWTLGVQYVGGPGPGQNIEVYGRILTAELTEK